MRRTRPVSRGRFGNKLRAAVGLAGLVSVLTAAVPDALAQSSDGDTEEAAIVSSDPAEPNPMPSAADAVTPDRTEPKTPPTTAEICSSIAENADKVGMDRDFFARLIWRESRFDIKAVSPVGARGIAQFMPYTARERGLADPYDFEEAIKHSALYLRDLRNDLGNWGLAAAAYNGGINRMKNWVAREGQTMLPYETVAYVNAITYRPVEWFLESGRDIENRPLDEDLSFRDACRNLPIMKTRAVFASLEGTEVAAKPWGVQIAGHANRSIALRIFQRVRSSYSSVFDGRDPMVVRDRNASRQRIYAVRIGADSRGEANDFCGKLRREGGSCIVVRN